MKHIGHLTLKETILIIAIGLLVISLAVFVLNPGMDLFEAIIYILIGTAILLCGFNLIRLSKQKTPSSQPTTPKEESAKRAYRSDNVFSCYFFGF